MHRMYTERGKTGVKIADLGHRLRKRFKLLPGTEYIKRYYADAKP